MILLREVSVLQSIVSLWFFTKFGADLITLSYVFSIAGVLTAFSFIVAAKIADRIGLVNTMVFTHVPSNVLLILVGLAPTLPLAIGFYLARMALSQMDVPTRQSYIVAVVNEDERTATAGITNISKKYRTIYIAHGDWIYFAIFFILGSSNCFRRVTKDYL